jgi:hypothetical protein
MVEVWGCAQTTGGIHMHLCRLAGIAVGISLLFCASTFAGGQGSAKDLYFEQMAKPQAKLNTGLTYWIELNRRGSIKRVNSTEAFKSGDRIKIHAIPNIDGYAYMIMLKGSTGKEAVLFPAPGDKNNNRVSHGKSYVIPATGNLVFDNHPGRETIRLALSRQPVDAHSLLNLPDDGTRKGQLAAGTSQQQEPVQITQTSLPAAPKNYLVSVDDPGAPASPELKDVAESDQPLGNAKDLFIEKAPVSKGHKSAGGTHKAPGGAHKTGSRPRIIPKTPASITVVNSLPSGQLFADIVLNHQ